MFFSTPSFRFRPLHCATLFGNELGWNARSEALVVAKSVTNAADVMRIPLSISRLSLRHRRLFLRRIAVAELCKSLPSVFKRSLRCSSREVPAASSLRGVTSDYSELRERSDSDAFMIHAMFLVYFLNYSSFIISYISSTLQSILSLFLSTPSSEKNTPSCSSIFTFL